MTTLRKTLIAALVVAAVGAGFYQTRQASRLRREVQVLQGQQAPMTDYINQLQSERKDLAKRLSALADEIERVKGNASELSKLRSEVDRLRQTEQAFAQLKASDATLSEAVSWKERVSSLQQHLAKNPEASIPELQFATEKDWIDAVRGELKTDKDYRRAMSGLRNGMENRFALQIQAALKRFMAANGQQFPSEISELEPYFQPPVDGAILQRYAIVPKGSDRAITLISPVDEEFDWRVSVDQKGWGSDGPPFKSPEKREVETALRNSLEPVVKAYMAANGGEQPTDPTALLPYIQTPEQRAAYEQALLLKKN